MLLAWQSKPSLQIGLAFDGVAVFSVLLVVVVISLAVVPPFGAQLPVLMLSTALGARQVFSNALPTSEFGLLSSNRISTSFIVACFQNGFGWHRPLAGAVRRLAGRNGEPHFSGNGAWEKPGAPGHSGWRVANRDGRVARSTHFKNPPWPGYFIAKPAKPWQTIVAQASQPAVSQVSKPACRVFSTTHPNVFAPLFS